jgi:hypothetical protein
MCNENLHKSAVPKKDPKKPRIHKMALKEEDCSTHALDLSDRERQHWGRGREGGVYVVAFDLSSQTAPHSLAAKRRDC